MNPAQTRPFPSDDNQLRIGYSSLSTDTRMNVPEDDELFIRRTMDEDPRLGVELLFRRYYQPMCSHAVKYVGSKSVAEDLVSDIFYQFYQQNIFTDITSSYRFYLLRTVRNRAFNYLKQQLNRQTVDEDADEVGRLAVSAGDAPDSLIQYEELYHDVQDAINDLPIDRRRIYLLNRFEGKKYQEIADELQLSIKTVEVQLYRANKHIRSLLKRKWYLLLLLLTSF
ncbi:RNA polymerase, sigma-24 subunit, ECF subfamily [Fibrisoma limi BUZ 3]|uniref:RNA polymerase, sigma-24 subunit, ECF subfamily n=1 Tax=Fibrisoma limi BUZ 3 TaxID=1185876 RepID=I2GHR9_9BACT|nr:RNA polymerase sigma-70 factor [Fibrisoma limi]CCH53444.1 RNA polymerase, sigma-24 subunit, ECF subfamily [Fibrisoma limi BUZ 3]